MQKFVMNHVRTGAGNTHVKFEVRGFNHFGAVTVSI